MEPSSSNDINEDSLTISVTLISMRKQTADGMVDLRIWDKKERTVRGLKALGLCWGLAMISIALPLLHFVLVPMFFIAGPVVFLFFSGQEQIVLGGVGECPDCKKSVKIEKMTAKWPLLDTCNHCRTQLVIEKKS